MQFEKGDDVTLELSASEIKILQQKIGSLLFYGRAVDMILPIVLSTLVSAQAHVTEATSRVMVQLLNYFATHPDAVIRYKQSDTILAIHINSSYLFESKSHSWGGGTFLLKNK